MSRRESICRHPGVILRGDFLATRGISQRELSRATGITEANISRLIHGQLDITPQLAARLAMALQTDASLWLVAQAHYDAQHLPKTSAVFPIRPNGHAPPTPFAPKITAPEGGSPAPKGIEREAQ